MRVHSLQDSVGRLSMEVSTAEVTHSSASCDIGTLLDAQFGTIPMCCGTKAPHTP